METLIEGARWAPSAFNMQPWRFLPAYRNRAGWEDLLGLLLPFNRAWAGDSSALVAFISLLDLEDNSGGRTRCESHSFDTGAAWACFALQATAMGLSCHAMTGFDVARAPAVLGIASNMKVEVIVAVGRQGDPSQLPEKLQGKERPSGRNPARSLILDGAFGRSGDVDRGGL